MPTLLGIFQAMRAQAGIKHSFHLAGTKNPVTLKVTLG
jgi:hypothetical protein